MPLKENTKTPPLPTWFCLSKYKFIDELTNGILVDEAVVRVKGIEGLSRPFNRFYLGNSDLKPTMLHEPLPIHLPDRIPWAEDRMFKRDGGFLTPAVALDRAKHSRHMRIRYAPSGSGDFELIVNLRNWTDKELLQLLAEQLPFLREKFNTPEPDKGGFGTAGPSTINRLINYKVIQMLDLMLWAKAHGFQYSAPQLSKALYPDERITAKVMHETRIPFALNFANIKYLDTLYFWLDSKGGDGKVNAMRLARDESRK
ncbi:MULTISPECIES: DUF6387 family protein [Aeromonas]|uniref:DUF6387 family protein n=1 Tax=Aeromonas TaxID=642 RepID=UPI0012F3E9F5|nr:DUF6387 family protein [Aeromonas salmonicida]VXA78300.1 conserved hypothetical protein [Aeromonas salmonicida]